MGRKSKRSTLILVRHGETVSNKEGRVQGHQDSPLTPRGLWQGERAARRLSGMKLTAVYASDAGRARETAEMIAAHHGLAVTSRADLRERCYGELEGRTLEEAEQNEGEWVAAWMADRQRIAPPGGETQAEMSERVMTALREIAGSHPGETVAVGAHGGPIKSAVFHILGAPVERWTSTFVANGSITILRGTPDMLRVVSFNDTCHLDAEEPGEAETES